MSGRWMKAARAFTGYEGVKRGELQQTTPQACRAVLQRLAERAEDCGVVSIYVADLAASTGLSERAVQYALAQLLADGWIWRAVRGQGSRAGDFRGTPAPTVYVLRPLTVSYPKHELDQDWLNNSWFRYAMSPRFRARPDAQRKAIRAALEDAWAQGLLPVDNRRPTRKEGTTYTQPVASSVTTGTTHYRRRGHLRPVPSLPWPGCVRPDAELPDLEPFVMITTSSPQEAAVL